jgi:hypothetical protein
LRQNRGLLIAGSIFVLAAAIYFFAERSPKTPTATPSPQASPIVGLSASQLQQVVIHAQGKVLTVNRQGNGFIYSVCPDGQADCPAAPADPTATLQLFQSLAQLRPAHVVYRAPEGLPAYGADKPTNGEIDIKSTTGQQITILVGIKTSDGANYFLHRQDSPDVVTVATTLVDTGLLGLVNHPPVPVPSPPPAVASPVPSP